MKNLCICPNCPTYSSVARHNRELLYRALGKAPSIAKEETCICPSYSVAARIGLEHDFFSCKSQRIT